jgi:hypothetical protein
MMNNKPKGKTPSLIGFANGAPCRVTVLKKSSCVRCKAAIVVGDDCFNIPQKKSGFTRERRYCKDCFSAVLQQTSSDLEGLQAI